ncbi:MAG TPA: hypothetical protein VGM36_05300, partial [Rhizomicrobium sp.]
MAFAAFATAVDARSKSPWSATLYAGVATNRNFTDLLDSGFAVHNAMAGFALNRRLVNLGGGFSLSAEGQITQYTFGHNYETAALGLGLEFNRFPWDWPTTFSAYVGPSYAINPVTTARYFKGKALLNYLGVELAVAIPKADGWDGVIRVYHRSGVWGIYSLSYDENSM